MAKPTPWLPPERLKMAVLMPISRPSMSTSAPPELPGLMAASVWMKVLVILDAHVAAVLGADDAGRDRLADAEGIADGQHHVAHLNLSLSAIGTIGRSLASIFTTAMSDFGSRPTTLAVNSRPS